MNELDPTTLKSNTWVYWIFNARIYQGFFICIEGDDAWLGISDSRIAFPLVSVKLYMEHPSAIHYGMCKTDNDFIDERAK